MSASEDALVHCPAIDNALAEVVWGVLAAADVDENPSLVAHAVVRNIREHEAGIADTCRCLPCPGRGNDGHGHTHCAECCMGTGVEADPCCPVHGDPQYAGANAVLAARDAGVLREAAEDADRSVVTGLETTRPDQVARWLRARAARIEAKAGESRDA